MIKRNKSLNTPVPHAQSGVFTLSAPAGAMLIAFAVFIAYLPCVTGEFVLDDNLFLTNNPIITAPDGLLRFWCTAEAPEFYPVSYTTNWIEWRLWQISPAGYHATNLILHVAEALLIWIILRKLSIPGAFWAALIFALHPVNVESVAWIAQRRNMAAMLFFLLSILWYLKFAQLAAAPFSAKSPLTDKQIPHPSSLISHHSSFILHPSSFRTWYCLSLAAFVLAMLGKGSTAVLPALVLGIVLWLRPLTRRDLLWTLPFFAVAAALTAVNVWFQTRGTEVVIRNAGLADRLAGGGAVVWFYLYKALLPLDLAFVYPQWHVNAGKSLSWLPLLAALALTAFLWLYRKTWTRPLLFAWGFFCVALVPVMGFVDVGFMQYSLVADHYQHIAIIGLIALAAAGLGTWQTQNHVPLRAPRWPWPWRPRPLLPFSPGGKAASTTTISHCINPPWP